MTFRLQRGAGVVSRADFSHIAVSPSVHVIFVLLSPPRSRHIACFSPVEWKAETVVSLSYLVSKCHHNLSVSITLICLFYWYGNSSTSLKPFFFPAIFQDCFEFLVITLSSLKAQIKNTHPKTA